MYSTFINLIVCAMITVELIVLIVLIDYVHSEGSNSASGSVCACHAAAPGSIPVAACGDLFLALQPRR